jgi:hypothetical protein
MSERKQKGEKKYDSSETRKLVYKCHNNFGQPFVSCPFEGRLVVRKYVMAWYAPGLQNDLPGANMITCIPVI